jgi:hypothetical protein
MAQIKGTALRGLLRHIKESGFPGGIPAAIAGLPPATREIFATRILASGWYPYAAYANLLTVIAPPAGPQRAPFLVELGRGLARRDAGTTFKIVAMFASAETMLERSALFWTRHCDTGSFTTVEMKKGSCGGLLSGFPDIDPLHCALVAGWIEGMAVAAGAKAATVDKTRCTHRGDPHCEYRVGWT